MKALLIALLLTAIAPQAPKGYEHVATINNVTLRAYCPCSRCCGKDSPGLTSTGQSAWVMDGCAVPFAHPSIRKFDQIYIPGTGFKEADDTGGVIKRKWRRYRKVQIEVRFTYHWQARNYGVKRNQTVKVYRKRGKTE